MNTCPLCHTHTTDLQPVRGFATCEACPTCRARLVQVQAAELQLRMIRAGFVTADIGREQ